MALWMVKRWTFLGGRFLKRTFPQKVKPVPSCETHIGMNIEQSKALSESNRRNRTSVAMIGLAVSMGAQGLILPQVSDAAPVAADSVSTDAAKAALPSAFDVAAASPMGEFTALSSLSSESKFVVVEHKVQEGQTLSRIARLYQVNPAEVLAANGLQADAVLRVGQVLRIPVDARIARLVDAAQTDAPIYYGPVNGVTAAPSAGSGTSISALSQGQTQGQIPGEASASQASGPVLGGSNAFLKEKQAGSITRLQEKRDSLRLSLGQLPAAGVAVAQSVDAVQTAPQRSTSVVAANPAPALQASDNASEEKAVKPNVTAILTPDRGAAVGSTSTPLSHRVEIGDTVNSIAKSYGISTQQLVEANRISDPNSIFVDQVLSIPQSQSFVPTTPRTAPILGASHSGVAPMLSPRVAERHAQAGFQPGMPAPQASSPALKSAMAPTFSGSSLGVTGTRAAGATSSVEAATPRSRYDYVENLRMEIVQLRDRYRTAAPAKIAPDHRVALASSAANSGLPARAQAMVEPGVSAGAVRNPEFVPNGYAESLRTQVRKLKAQGGQAPSHALAGTASRTVTTARAANNSVVAMAPVGSQNYAPIGQSIGRMVSPELPPLGSGDVYLPSGSGKFTGYIWPAKGLLTSGYGYRWGRMHRGIDVAAPTGTPVVAAAAGVVVTAGWNDGGYGNLVEVKHPDGSLTLYGHNDRILVREGQEVAQGQQLAEMGSTGYSTGPHCHFEIHPAGQGAVNPMAYLPREGA